MKKDTLLEDQLIRLLTMKGIKINFPIMTNSESIHQFGNNAYGKPATAMNILRETIMGRELLIMHLKCTLTDGCSNIQT